MVIGIKLVFSVIFRGEDKGVGVQGKLFLNTIARRI
jgi:hypothetical protein